MNGSAAAPLVRIAGTGTPGAASSQSAQFGTNQQQGDLGVASRHWCAPAACSARPHVLRARTALERCAPFGALTVSSAAALARKAHATASASQRSASLTARSGQARRDAAGLPAQPEGGRDEAFRRPRLRHRQVKQRSTAASLRPQHSALFCSDALTDCCSLGCCLCLCLLRTRLDRRAETDGRAMPGSLSSSTPARA